MLEGNIEDGERVDEWLRSVCSTLLSLESAMSFDGPVIQTPNQERRRIQRPPVIVLIIIAIVLTGVFTWATVWR